MSMKTVSNRNDPVIETRDQLVAAIAKGEKPKERWRIGTEHEKFVYCRNDYHAPSYEEPGGIRDLLMAMTEFGWTPVYEGDNVIALKGEDGAVSLEPAGQLEHDAAHLHDPG
jgi:glutamate--cysteine ligase